MYLFEVKMCPGAFNAAAAYGGVHRCGRRFAKIERGKGIFTAITFERG